ncbi:MAG: signal peptidase I [Paludibacteraceae bacterium]|nr:signal peptidase I [Paludibacteraceae bacterium]
MESTKKTFTERLLTAGVKQWVKFALVVLMLLLFLAWSGAWWLLLFIPLALEVYITRYVSWSAWKESKNPILKNIAEFVDAIVFALVAVYLINIFFFQNYVIPSPSLEKTLKVGDYLFVSKLSYGPRCPMTPLSFPLAQHTMPGTEDTKSYVEWIKWDYKRLCGLGSVQRNDIVVFNFPAGDTVAVKVQNPDYYTLVNEVGRERVWGDHAVFGDIIARPVDRRENYVKRCVALPGDTFSIIDGVVHVNGVKQDTFPGLQHNYLVEVKSPRDIDFDKLDVRKQDRRLINRENQGEAWLAMFGYLDTMSGKVTSLVYDIPLTEGALKKLQNNKSVLSIRKESDLIAGGKLFPWGMNHKWTKMNYGPIVIPQKGATVQLTTANLPLYEQIIRNYELNDLKVTDGQIIINGEVVDSYTFKMDYYWMMGDNRDNSADSRYWGFVPEDHIVGKPIFIWLSLDEDKSFPASIRWNRIFTMVHPD